MSREHRNSREDKKKPLSTHKEKRAVKHAKKAGRDSPIGELKR